MNNVETAIAKTKKLFLERPTGFWAENLIEGSSSIKTAEDWTHYYAWLAAPDLYDPKKVYTTTNETPVFELPPGLKMIKMENGPCETIVHVTAQEAQDDEKADTQKFHVH